ncbi:unnamed protein product [Camellia sinensis]
MLLPAGRNTLQDRSSWEIDLGLIEELGLVRLSFFSKLPCFALLSSHTHTYTRHCRFSAVSACIGQQIAYVSDSARYVSGIGRYGCEIQSRRYTGEYPTRPYHFPVRTGRYGTYRPIFRTLNVAEAHSSDDTVKLQHL